MNGEYDENCSLASEIMFRPATESEYPSDFIDRPFYMPGFGWSCNGKDISRNEAMKIYADLGEDFPGEKPFIDAFGD